MNTEISESIFVDPDTENSIVNLLSILFDFAYMEPLTARKNLERGSSGGMPAEDRTIPACLAEWLVDKFSLIYFSLIANEVFRDAVADAVAIEICLDEKDSAFVSRIRQDMKKNTVYEPESNSEDNYLIDFSTNNDILYHRICTGINTSFENISEYDDAINEMADELDDEERTCIGFIACNFMYLLRALIKNEFFMHYVKTVVRSVETQLDILI